MLLVKTKIRESPIHGIGLFADEPIKKGTTIWKFAPGFDLDFSEKDLKNLSGPSKEQFLKYIYMTKNKGMILCFDDARFLNHSENPNCEDIDPDDFEEGFTIAKKDIKTGEELTVNYRTFDFNWKNKLNK